MSSNVEVENERVEGPAARYTGTLVLKPLPDGRRMETVLKFGFLDSDGLHWAVPVGATVDGASIPKPLWWPLGGPFEGKYRDASVVHDYYCAVRSADYIAVHRMFYRAMLVSGVSAAKAKLMYSAVHFAGPKWDDMVVANVRLGPPAIPTPIDQTNVLLSVQHDPLTLAFGNVIEFAGVAAIGWLDPLRRRPWWRKSDIVLRLDKLLRLIEEHDIFLDCIDENIFKALSFIPNVGEAKKFDVYVGRDRKIFD